MKIMLKSRTFKLPSAFNALLLKRYNRLTHFNGYVSDETAIWENSTACLSFSNLAAFMAYDIFFKSLFINHQSEIFSLPKKIN
jgi:hypothetical protein